MEAKRFLKLIRKHRITLIIVPLLVVAISAILVRKMQNVYVSKANLSAGITDQSQQLLVSELNLGESKTNQAFSNMIQMFQMKNVFDQLSFQLIIHDLTAKEPFRPPSKLLGYLNKEAKRHAEEVYKDCMKKRQPLDLLDPDQKGLQELLESMKYDYGSLTKKIKIYRVENSDFITAEFESESPLLCQFVVNTLCDDFIAYYTSVTNDNQLKAVDFLKKLVNDKRDSLDHITEGLKKYKINNNVLNLNQQGGGIFTQIQDFETRIQLAEKDIAAYEGALKSIDKKFEANNVQYYEGAQVKLNQDILQTKQQLTAANEELIKSGYKNEAIRAKAESLKTVMERQINESTDKYIMNPMATKENLLSQKVQLEVNLDLAKNSVKSLQEELTKLNAKFKTLVPNEAAIQKYETDLTVSNAEYLELLRKYNASSMAYNQSVKLKVIERAMPGGLQPSKKLVIVAMSGLVSFVLCMFVLFVMFYIDNSLRIPLELAYKTGIPVLGFLPGLKNITSLDLKQLWDDKQLNPDTQLFKNQLRSARFEIENSAPGATIININSLGKDAGKTMLAISLASAYLVVNKKVLLIDGNFTNPSITSIIEPDCYIEDYLHGKVQIEKPWRENVVVVAGNRGTDTSLFEVCGEKLVREKMQALKSEFDVIIIESSALDSQNKSKEWCSVSDKVLAVFRAGKTITQHEKLQLEYLKTINGKFLGWVMNNVTEKVD